jgi:apolipoprotein N-acyltransferase
VRVRAAEEGIPIVRSANNGISALIDADGRIVADLGLNEKGVIDAVLPAAKPPPPYARWGDWLFGVNLLIFGLWWLYLRSRPVPVVA